MARIQICWTTGVSEPEASAVQSGVADVLKHVTHDFIVESMGETCDADTWIQRCLREIDRGYGPQADADCVLTGQIPYSLVKYASAIGQQPASVSRLTVVATDADITGEGNRFLFGAGRAGIGSVLSVARLRGGIGDTKEREGVLRRLARHEFGHAPGLIPEGRSVNVEDKLGLHCTNICTMRQGMCLSEFEELTMEEERAGIAFCDECGEYLRSGLANLKLLFGGQL